MNSIATVEVHALVLKHLICALSPLRMSLNYVDVGKEILDAVIFQTRMQICV